MTRYASALTFGYSGKFVRMEAMRYNKISIDDDNSMRMAIYGYHLEYFNHNIVIEVKFYKLSADRGNSGGMSNYGKCLENGEVVHQNRPLATYYFKMSAEAGLSKAMNTYGVALEEGYDGPPNLTEAVKYYKLSAEERNEYGMSIMQYAFWKEKVLEKNWIKPFNI
jgi:hypothetical protein